VGKENAKNKCEHCDTAMRELYELSQALDRVVRNAQSAETYGLPIGPDHSLLLAEILGKRVTSDFIKELKTELRSDFYVIRHVDDFKLFLSNQASMRTAINLFRKTLLKYNLQPNELKIKESLLSDPSRSSWLIELTNFATDENNNVIELSKRFRSHQLILDYLRRIGYIDKNSKLNIKYQIIDSWQLVNYISKIKELQNANPDKSVVTYGLRRLHFNVFVNPTKRRGKPYLMNFDLKFLNTLDAELAKLLMAYSEYIDVITDVYLWYSFYHKHLGQKSFQPSFPFLQKAIIHLLKVLDTNGEHFEVSWALWLATYYKMPLTSDLLNQLSEYILHPIIALLYFNYLFATRGDTEETREYAKKLSRKLMEAVGEDVDFLTSNWLLLYSIARSPWAWLVNLWSKKISKIHGDKFVGLLTSQSVDFFSWACKDCMEDLSPVQQALGLSRKGRGGVTARTYLT